MNEVNTTDIWTVLTIIAMALITSITRSFFFLSSKPWQLPRWAERGLAFAPIAALAAVVIPEVTMLNGSLITTWQDARIYGAVAGAAYFFWRKGVLGTIVMGMAVFMPLRIGLGW